MASDECQALPLLNFALEVSKTPRVRGVRDQRRDALDRAVELLRDELGRSPDPTSRSRCLRLLLVALATRAEDARYGAGQLARGAQRAPTVEACLDGWERVGEIVGVSERAASEAEQIARELGARTSPPELGRARAASTAARQLIRERNDAYTFHTDPRFSFGEGWYVAAAALLAGVLVQVEPGQRHSESALHFLQQAGLASQLVPYRSRPRANKSLPDLVAQSFRRDGQAAAERVRTHFLGGLGVPPSIAAFVEQRVAGYPGPSVLVWIRAGVHHPHRNTSRGELIALCEVLRDLAIRPILVGDAVPSESCPSGALDLSLFWREALFQGRDMRRAQLQVFEHLRHAYGVLGQIGVTTAGMDGPALLGLRTLYLTDEPNVRLGRWVGAVPGYQEVVRGVGYLERVRAHIEGWSQVRSGAQAAAQR